jgi:hypothetical protein
MRKVWKIVLGVLSVATVVAPIFVKNPENRKKMEEAEEGAGAVITVIEKETSGH